MRKTTSSLIALAIVIVIAAGGHGQDTKAGPVTVVIKDGKVTAEEASLPVDPNPRIRIGGNGGFRFGLSVDNKRLCCSPEGSIWSTARIDNQEYAVGDDGRGANPQPLPDGPNRKKRIGMTTSSTFNNVHVTQTLEIVPSKPLGKVAQGQKRQLDSVRITYLIENKDNRVHMVEWRVGIDMMINNNDGALYAAPTEPGKVINGVVLKDKTLPEYVMCLERPDVKDPGFVAFMTLKPGGKGEGPSKVVLTNLGAMFGGWDIPAQAAGDSACALYWEPKNLKPGEKRELVWCYGGGIAGNPENDGKVSLALGGSFEPGKLFTITAMVNDPVPSQTLTLELPAGMERIEGKERQPVPVPMESGNSVVLWKARVLQTGDYELKVRSSTGVTQSKEISIRR